MHPSCINSNGNTSISTDDQQWMIYFGCYSHKTPNLMTTNMQSTMENNGSFVGVNSQVILGNNCLTGKKSSKKDRHSKINTARGPKDRRMRLSLDVAKKFFRLQDLLGFDKASNTIQWLLMKSQPAIQDLQLNQSHHKPSFCSDDCEVLSVKDDQLCSGNKEKKSFENDVRKITREKARERARKRTTEKKSIKLGGDGEVSDQYSKLKASLDKEIMDQNTNRLGFWIPFEEDQDQVQVQLTDDHLSSHFKLKQGMVGEYGSSMMSNSWSPSFLFNYHHDSGPFHEVIN
ncbi:hypothetical protein E3N88_20925 [Mikania micrantha]|uniref:TCP domain-containing protein n=1 Tax=Mikania micrantha TaxID=192012 RepID=A0A5N6NIH4_9ASTR|nr:hypothetical protein E3N88_20925 [Mikania micrantha]